MLSAKLGGHDLYRMVFDPFETPEPEPIEGSISDDLADIWLDAVSVCRFSFEYHWGPHHAAHAVRPLFGLLLGENPILSDAPADSSSSH
jgi:aldehyde:ferredoxin oxidoreductase